MDRIEFGANRTKPHEMGRKDKKMAVYVRIDELAEDMASFYTLGIDLVTNGVETDSKLVEAFEKGKEAYNTTKMSANDKKALKAAQDALKEAEDALKNLETAINASFAPKYGKINWEDAAKAAIEMAKLETAKSKKKAEEADKYQKKAAEETAKVAELSDIQKSAAEKAISKVFGVGKSVKVTEGKRRPFSGVYFCKVRHKTGYTLYKTVSNQMFWQEADSKHNWAEVTNIKLESETEVQRYTVGIAKFRDLGLSLGEAHVIVKKAFEDVRDSEKKIKDVFKLVEGEGKSIDMLNTGGSNQVWLVVDREPEEGERSVKKSQIIDKYGLPDGETLETEQKDEEAAETEQNDEEAA